MKKFLALLLVGCMVVAMTACSGSGDTSSSEADSSSEVSSEESSEESSKEESSESSSESSSEASSESSASELSGTVTLGGSTSVEKCVNAFIEQFTEDNPGVEVTYDPTGSGAGITGAQEGSLDIGLSSRALHDDETGLTATTFALDGIAIIVNNENTLEDISIEDIAKIAKGEVTNWSDVGGSDGDIVMIGREAGSGTRDGFESIVGVSDECQYDQELTSTGAVIAAVASNPNAIGYASLSAVDDTIKCLTVNGVECNVENVQNGTYEIQRPFNFITVEGGTLSEAAQAFMDFCLSSDAEKLIEDAGAVPVK